MKRNGFTLVEILAAIMILAIISTFVMFGINSIIESSRVETTKKSVQNMFALSYEDMFAKGKIISNEKVFNVKNGKLTNNDGEEIPLETSDSGSGYIFITKDDLVWGCVEYDFGLFYRRHLDKTVQFEKSGGGRTCDSILEEYNAEFSSFKGVYDTSELGDAYTIPILTASTSSFVGGYNIDVANEVEVCWLDHESNTNRCEKKSMGSSFEGARTMHLGDTFTVQYFAHDDMVNFDYVSEAYEVRIVDTTPPEILSVEGNTNEWTIDKTLVVNATDLSGVLWYSFDGGATFDGSNSKTITENGTYKIMVCDSLDEDKNCSERDVVVGKISVTPPTVSISKGNVGSNSIVVKATVVDNEMGLNYIEYSIDNGTTWVKDGTNMSHLFTGLTKNKAYSIKARATSKNTKQTTTSTLSVTTSDITAPTYKVNTTGWATSKTVTITYPTVDNTTLTRQYSTDGGKNWTTSSSNTQTVTFTANGSVIARVTDGTNTVTGSTYSVSNIDTQNPTATYAIASGTAGTNGWYKSNVGVKITPSAPGGSGVSSYKYCTTTSSSCTPSTAVSGSAATTVTLSTQSASNKICTAVTSGAGKSYTVCSGVYKIDKTGPTITVDGHTSSFTKTGYTSDPTGTATDNLTSSVSVTKSGTVNKNAAGTYKVTYSATDAAGNSSSLVMTVVVKCSSSSSSQQTAHFGNRANYSGSSHTLQFTAPGPGTYTFELYGGASVGWGSRAGTGGGYLKGSVSLSGGETIKVVTGAIGGWIGCWGSWDYSKYADAGSTIAYVNGTRIMEAQGGSMNANGSRRYGKGDYYHAGNVTVITSSNQNWQTTASGCPNNDKKECAAEGEAKVSYSYTVCSS